MKKTLYLVLAGALMLSTVSCGQQGTTNSNEGNVVDTEQKTEDTNTNVEADKYDSLYDAFLNGEATLSTDYYLNNASETGSGYENDFFSIIAGDELTLPEMVETLNEAFMDDEGFFAHQEISSISYSYLDCGNDGEKELAVKFVCPVVEPDSNIVLVIKEIDSKLQVVYSVCSWSRSETTINEYGFIQGGGSGGAINHSSDAALIDADGKYQFGYILTESADLEDFGYAYEHEDFDASSLEGTLCIYELRLTFEPGADKPSDYFSYAVYDSDTYEEIDVPNLYTDSPYKEVLDSFTTIKFVPYDELEKAISDKLDSIGATEDVRNANELEFTEIAL